MVEKRRPNENGVIINVYVESRISRSDQKTNRVNPIQYLSQPRVNKTRGYDRRAQLLAYARELRHADPRLLRKPPKNLRRKSKTRQRWSVAVERIKRLFSRLHGRKRQWKYEPIVRDDCSHGRTRKSHFCKKLVCLFKKISGAWKCKNGGY